MSAPASVDDVRSALNTHAASFGYSCVARSWEDVQRGKNADGTLSAYGPNITDVWAGDKQKRPIYTLRSPNFNEKLARVSTRGIAVVHGNLSNTFVNGARALETTTLQKVLASVAPLTGKNGVCLYSKDLGFGDASSSNEKVDLTHEQLDAHATIRFQVVFLPVSGEGKFGAEEFLLRAYNYQAQDDNPRNLQLYVTPQGLSMQTDCSGAQVVPFQVRETGSQRVDRHWLEAERAEGHKVGGAQKETKEEAEAAAARGKATARFIGTEAMGTRFNVQLLVQVPLKQKQRSVSRSFGFGFGTSKTIDQCIATGGGMTFGAAVPSSGSSSFQAFGGGMSLGVASAQAYGIPESYFCFGGGPTKSLNSKSAAATTTLFAAAGVPSANVFGVAQQQTTNHFEKASPDYSKPGAPIGCPPPPPGGSSFGSFDATLDLFGNPSVSTARGKATEPAAAAAGTSNAARISVGSAYDKNWQPPRLAQPLERDTSQHVTITATMFYTVVGGVPSKADVEAACRDLDELYTSCGGGKPKELAKMHDVVAPAGTWAMPSAKPAVFAVMPHGEAFPMSD